ncbi:O-antigen ligase family protein [Flavobacteriaceae bacterium]|nr:O-antigen ligase family protein [Flavobacteriaceae bacterium]
MKLDKRSIIFLLNILVFSLDSVLNYFYDFPVFVVSLLFYFVVLIVPGFFSFKKYHSFLIIILFFLLSFIFNTFRDGFYKESLSDFLFIISFFGSFYLFSDSISLKNNNKLILFFLLTTLLLFSGTYLGFDQNKWGNTIGLKTDDIEFSRSYRQGFFRKAHIASYFFTFTLLYFMNRLKSLKANKLTYIVTIVPLTYVIFITGSRTPIVVMFLGLILFYFKIKYLKYLIIFVVLSVGLIIFIDEALVLFSDTIIYQYITIIKTIFSNFERLSRIIIWASWWSEVKTFNLIDYVFGRGFNASIVANQKNVSNSIWFHNDFLSIFYSYGILPLIIYINLFVKIYKKHKKIIRSNVFIFLTFSGFWLSAFFNGFYYYYTVILLYLFYTMIYESNEVSDIRD